MDGPDRTTVYMHPPVYRVHPAAEQRQRRTAGAARPGPTRLGADEQHDGLHHARAPQPCVRRYVVATRVGLGDDGVYRAVRRSVDKRRSHQRSAFGGRGFLGQARRRWHKVDRLAGDDGLRCHRHRRRCNRHHRRRRRRSS